MAFNFQQITIPFQAGVANAISGVKQLQAQIVSLGQTVQVANKYFTNFFNNTQPGQLRQQNGDPFRAIDNSTLRVIDRLARFLTAIASVKGALDLVFGASSNVSKAFESAGEGLRVFSNLAQLAKDNLGLVAAGLVGLAAAVLIFITQVMQARIKATTAMTEATIKSQDEINDYKRSVEAATIAGDAFNDTYGEQAVKSLALNRSAFEAASKQLVQLTKEKEKADAAVNAILDHEDITPKQGRVFNYLTGKMQEFTTSPVPSEELKAAQAAADSVDTALKAIKTRMDDIKANAAFLTLASQLGVFTTKIRDTQLQLSAFQREEKNLIDIAKNLQPHAEFGQNLVEEQQIKNAQTLFKLRTEQLVNLQNQQGAAQELLNVITNLNNVHSTDERKAQIAELTAQLKGLPEVIGTATNGLLDAQKKLFEALAPGKFTQAFTIPLTDAISSAVISGITSGARGAEILANVTKNLLTAALNDVAKRFQQGMIDVMKEIAGAGGELLGSALITVVGVVAGVLGRKKSSSDSFASIANQVTSSESVRGIVAGPTNVAIAAVGENLKRALVGVESRLDVLIQVSTQIRDRVGGVPFAGSVAS